MVDDISIWSSITDSPFFAIFVLTLITTLILRKLWRVQQQLQQPKQE
jgi:hypothetical protein